MNPCICKVVTNVFYLNLNSIHSWKSVTRVVVVFVKPVAGLNTSGDHAPASETNDPAETAADPGLAVPVLGVTNIDGIEL